MTLEKQYAALAKVMGYEKLSEPRPASFYTIWHRPMADYMDKYGIYLTKEQLPNFNSLDVLHEVEKKLTPDQAHKYCTALGRIVIRDSTHPDLTTTLITDWIFHATAAQRREAILRTLGLWSDEPQTT